jgi:hypothetical protein
MFIFPRPLAAVAAGLAVALAMVGVAAFSDTGAAPGGVPGSPNGAAGAARETRGRMACVETRSTSAAYDTGACAWDTRWGIVRAGS